MACCRSLLDALLESLDSSSSTVTTSAPADSNVFDQKKDDVPSSSQTARILNLFAFLVNQTQATVKAAFLYLPLSGLDFKYYFYLLTLCLGLLLKPKTVTFWTWLIRQM